MTACTASFLELENDFSLTPLQALSEKISILQEQARDKDLAIDKKEKTLRKLEKLLRVENFMNEFTDYVNETTWNRRFDVPLVIFLEMCIDQNLKLFMNMETRGDLQLKDSSDDNQENLQDRKAKYSPAPSKSAIKLEPSGE